MAGPEDMIVPMLCEMRVEISSMHSRMDERFDEIDKVHKFFQHALAGDSLLGRFQTGEFGERIAKLGTYGDRLERLEDKFCAFEGRS